MSDHSHDHQEVRLTIAVTTVPAVDAAVVIPQGEIDLTTSEALRVAMNQAVEAGATALVLDLSDVTFMDSTALGVLVSFHRRLGERLVLAAAPPIALRVLEVTNFTSVLQLTDSVTTALDALRP